MSINKFLQKFTPQMDLAIEAHDLLRGKKDVEIENVSHSLKQFPSGSVTTIKVLNEEGEKLMGRPIGTYITIESTELRHNNIEAHKNIIKNLADALKGMINNLGIGADEPILVVGLGNWNATPDALGPQVVDTILITRHLFQFAPEELRGGLRPVCGLAPGVLGITGIETAEIIQGVVEKTKPSLVIAIDALAAGNVDRIASTIQLSDTGISPGSGIGNQRQGLNMETMGVPVIAVGVPTVVNAVVIAYQLFGNLLEQDKALHQHLPDEMLDVSIRHALGSFGTNLTVTPKEIDQLVANAAKLTASGLNQALHIAIDPRDYGMYLQ